MKRWIVTLGIGGFLVAGFILRIPSVRADDTVGCPQDLPFEHDALPNSVFGPAELINYVNGYLAVHFQITRDLYTLEDWSPAFVLVDDQCRQIVRGGLLKISNPQHAPFRNLSIRFTSPTEWIFWNDDTDARFVCGACQGRIDPVGQFFKVRVSMYASDRPTSSAHSPPRRIRSWSIPLRLRSKPPPWIANPTVLP